MKKLNLIGQRYNRLTVIERASPIKHRSAWLCHCYCGNIKIIKTEELRSGGTKSCGCWNDEQRSIRAENMYSKNIKYTPLEASAHRVWRSRYKEMPYKDFYEICQKNCYYCGTLPSNYQNAAEKKSSQNMKQNGFFKYNGLDRINNSLPHSKENCVPCCKWCNYAKRDRTVEEFKTWVAAVYNIFVKNEP